jgi:hypothetical protein
MYNNPIKIKKSFVFYYTYLLVDANVYAP